MTFCVIHDKGNFLLNWIVCDTTEHIRNELTPKTQVVPRGREFDKYIKASQKLATTTEQKVLSHGTSFRILFTKYSNIVSRLQ
jgi:hypothetical protein